MEKSRCDFILYSPRRSILHTLNFIRYSRRSTSSITSASCREATQTQRRKIQTSITSFEILKIDFLVRVSRFDSFIQSIRWFIIMASTNTSSTEIKCAPSNNLNVGYPQFPTAKELHASLVELTSVRFAFCAYIICISTSKCIECLLNEWMNESIDG